MTPVLDDTDPMDTDTLPENVSTLISIEQTMHEDHTILNLKYDKEQVFIERFHVNELYKTMTPKSTFILAQTNQYSAADLQVLLTEILVGILLENGTTLSYRSSVALMHGNAQDQKMRDMAHALNELSFKYRDSDFEKHSREYESRNAALYKTVLQMYTFSGDTYAEYAAQSAHIQTSVERMVRLFIMMNQMPCK